MTDAQTGETLIGANVVIKEPYKGAMADIDGNYSLEGLAPGTYEVTGSFIGYTPISETVEVGDGVTIVNFNLYIETYVIEQAAEVVAKVIVLVMCTWKTSRKVPPAWISSPASRSNKLGTATQRVPSNAFRSGLRNFVFVRGLSDRYIKTTLAVRRCHP